MAACTVCAHPDREAIDRDLVGGKSARSVAEAHGLTRHAIDRHKASHLSKALKAVQARRETRGAQSALDRLERLHGRAEAILTAAEGDGNLSMSLAAVKELRGLVMDLARLTGEFDDKPTVQVLNLSTNPEWLQVTSTLMAALEPFPEARAAAAAALAGRRVIAA